MPVVQAKSKPKRPYRLRTNEERLALLAEARATSFHGTAQRHGIRCHLLFLWRKKLSQLNVQSAN